MAVHTGDMVLGHTGPGGRRSFTALGPAVTLAERLTRSARPGEVLVTGATLTAALADLPGNWQVADTTEDAPELRPTGDAVPLPADLRGRVVLVGPNVAVSPETATFRFRYRHVLPRRGVEPPLAVLAVDRPDQTGAQPYAEIHNLALTSQDRVIGRYQAESSRQRSHSHCCPAAVSALVKPSHRHSRSSPARNAGGRNE